VLKIDLGELGVRTRSVQLTGRHRAEDLLGRQVVVVTNFRPKRVAGVSSEVLVLAAVLPEGDAVVIGPTQLVPNGSRIA
jgi:tRNA-binding protein